MHLHPSGRMRIRAAAIFLSSSSPQPPRLLRDSRFQLPSAVRLETYCKERDGTWIGRDMWLRPRGGEFGHTARRRTLFSTTCAVRKNRKAGFGYTTGLGAVKRGEEMVLRRTSLLEVHVSIEARRFDAAGVTPVCYRLRISFHHASLRVLIRVWVRHLRIRKHRALPYELDGIGGDSIR